jgi:hypothetical protein
LPRRVRDTAVAALVVFALALGSAAPAVAAVPADGPGAGVVAKKPGDDRSGTDPTPQPGKGQGKGKQDRPTPAPTSEPTPPPEPEPSPSQEPAPPVTEPSPTPLAVASDSGCRVTSVVVDSNSKQATLRPGESAPYNVRWQTGGKCSSASVLWSTDQPGGAFSASSASKSPASTTFIAGGTLGSNWRITATVTVQPGGSQKTDDRFVDVKADSVLTASAAAGRAGQEALLSATLSSAAGPLAGRTIAFAALGRSLGATTDASGVAAAALSLAEASAGSFAYTASFAGDAQFRASSATGSLTVRPSDTTPPTIGPSVSGPIGMDGWTTGDTFISWSVADAESAVDSSAGCGTLVISTDTPGTTVTCRASSAGGAATASVTVKRDATVPSIAASRAPANEHGWNATDVTVTFTCQDAMSGIASCPSPVIISAEGAAQSAIGTAQDRAGNSRTVTVSGISIDRSAPTITATRTAPASLGWNNGDVTVTFSCGDALSGIAACSRPVTLSAEGAGQSASGSATDRAGHGASVTVPDVNIDRTAPTIAFTGLRTYGVDEMVDVACVAADALSGIASVTCANGGGEAYAFVLWPRAIAATAADIAGNIAEAQGSVSVVVTTSGLCELTKRFSSSSVLGSSLCVKLSAAELAESKGNDLAKWAAIDAYQKEIAAQDGKAFTHDEALALIALAFML